jgi:hypothetical protein
LIVPVLDLESRALQCEDIGFVLSECHLLACHVVFDVKAILLVSEPPLYNLGAFLLPC